MKSIIEYINELELKEWNYYDKNYSLQIPFNNNKHVEFIREYFKLADKEQAFTNFFPQDCENFSRAKHSNSIFFLGCIFYKYLVKDKQGFFVRGHDHFYFLWFLICLAHDFSFDKEKNQDCENIKDILFKLNYKLLEFDFKGEHPIPKFFKNIEKYYDYRCNEGKIDHGIRAGLKLFDVLIENRIQREENQKKKIEKNNLYWGKDLETLYYLACSAIAIHNIWTPDSKKEQEYKDNGLDDLVTLEKIKFDTFPFYVLLCIVDTIDPIKIYDCCDSNYAFQNILIDFPSDNTIIFQSTKYSGLNFNKFIQKAKELEKWLSVDIQTTKDNNQVTIKILQAE